MKKLLLALVLLAGTATTAHAQKASFGLRAGLVLSNFAGEGDFTENIKPGLVAGVVAALPLSAKLRIQPELLFVQKGFQYNQVEGHPRLDLSYLDLPVLARYSCHAEGLFLELGPQVGWLLGASDPFAVPQTNKDIFRSFDLGYVGGAGYQLRNGLSLSLRYNGSVRHVFKPRTDPKYRELADRNSALQLTASYMFGGK